MKEEKPAFRFNEQSPEARWRRLDAAHRAAHDALMARSGLERIGNPVLLMILAHQPGGVITVQAEETSIRISGTVRLSQKAQLELA